VDLAGGFALEWMEGGPDEEPANAVLFGEMTLTGNCCSSSSSSSSLI